LQAVFQDDETLQPKSVSDVKQLKMLIN
jgi:hypothetical protein